MINKLKKFIGEVKVELKKVAWPDKDELTGATSVVIVTVLLLAIYIGIWDFPLSKFVRVLIR